MRKGKETWGWGVCKKVEARRVGLKKEGKGREEGWKKKKVKDSFFAILIWNVAWLSDDCNDGDDVCIFCLFSLCFSFLLFYRSKFLLNQPQILNY